MLGRTTHPFSKLPNVCKNCLSMSLFIIFSVLPFDSVIALRTEELSLLLSLCPSVFLQQLQSVHVGLCWKQSPSLSLLSRPTTHLSFLSLSFLRQDATGWTQSTGMVLSNQDGSEKEITPVRQPSPTPPKNHRSYTV